VRARGDREDEAGVAGQARYRMLDTIRDYAAARLAGSCTGHDGDAATNTPPEPATTGIEPDLAHI
jgi:hypothetical protein